jgi:hypothetical protein
VRVEFYQPAEEHERYAPHAFDRIIGQDAPFKIEGTEHGRATVVAVKVDEDGRGATWTVDITGGDSGPAGTPAARAMSFSIPELPDDLFRQSRPY